MKVIIAGGRDIREYAIVEAAIVSSGYTITEVVSGCQMSTDQGERYGADYFGEQWAALNGIPVKLFPADWTGQGKRAGPLRNEAMAAYAQALILVWDGKSRGSADMLRRARAHDLYIAVYRADCSFCGRLHRKDRTCAGAAIDWPARKARALAYKYTIKYGEHVPPYQDYE